MLGDEHTRFAFAFAIYKRVLLARSHAPPRSRSEQLAPWVAAALIALPALLARFPPMTDYPMHVSQVALIRHFGDARLFPPDLYQLNPGYPNQLFHWCAAGLAFLVGVDTGCKIMVAVAQAGIILAGARLASYLGVSRWTALLLAPIALGWVFYWGLIANLLGLATLLASLPTLDRAVERASARGALTSCGWMLLLYLAHESAMVVACSAVLVFTFGHELRGHIRDALVRLAPIAFASMVFVAQIAVQRQHFDTDRARSPVIWHSLAARLRSLPATLTGTLDPVTRWALFGLCIGAILVFASGRFSVRSGERRSLVEWIHHLRFELVALVNAVAYFVMPFGFDGGTMFNHRFYHPAYCLAALTLAPRLVRRAPKMFEKLASGAVASGVLLIGWPQFVDADETSRQLDQILAYVADGSAVTLVEVDPRGGERSFSAEIQVSRALVAHGGRLAFSLSSSVIAPVQFDPRFRWLEAQERLEKDTLMLRPDHDLRMFRYVLIHSRDPAPRLIATVTLEPEGHFVESVGEWSLVESRLPLVPLDSPELPMPVPPPETLRKRAKVMMMNSAHDDGAEAAALPGTGNGAVPPTP